MSLAHFTDFLEKNERGLAHVDVLLGDLTEYRAGRKFVVRFKTGTVVEIQIMEFETSWNERTFPISTTLLAHPLSIDAALGVEDQSVAVPTLDALLGLKRCHLNLPVRWRKNASQVAQILKLCNAASLKPLDAEYLKLRMSENFEIYRMLQQERGIVDVVPSFDSSVTAAAQQAVISAGYNEFPTFLKLDSQSGPCLDPWFMSRIELSSWASCSPDEKICGLSGLIGCVASLLYFSNPSELLIERLAMRSGKLWSSLNLFAQELWFLSLESLFTGRHILPDALSYYQPAHLSYELFLKTTAIYAFSRRPEDLDDYDLEEAKTKEGMDASAKEVMEKLPGFWELGPTDDFKSEFLDEFSRRDWVSYDALFSCLHLLFDTTNIPKWFLTLCEPTWHQIVAKRNIAVSSGAPTLPQELWSEIFNQVGDHVTFLRLSAVNKTTRLVGASDALWASLEDRTLGSGTVFRLSGESWPKAFKRAIKRLDEEMKSPTTLCPTCGERHKKMTIEEWRNSNPEHAWDNCPCPECDAGSWGTCHYQSRFFF